MLSLYEILKASKTGIAPDMWTALAGMNWGGKDSGAKVKELTGIPPLSFKADGTPLLDYLISGNMVQTGAPTPQNPIQPNETGDRTGNLFDKTAEYVVGGTTYNYTISGLDPNKYYTCSTNFERISGVNTASVYFNGGSSVNNGVWSDAPKTFKPNANGEIIVYLRYVEASGAPIIINDVMTGKIWVMVNESEEPVPYEPYGYKLPITSAGQTNNIYLGEVPTTRRIKKIILNGKENWSTTAASDGRNSFILILNNALDADTSHVTSICTHIPLLPSGGTYTTDNGYTITKSELYMRLTSTYNSLSDFKSYLAQQYAAGTPITIWYVLAEPETGIVNEPLRKIGDYADTVSMEQAGVEIPTNNGNTVIDVETTLKPSEMYIKYLG